MKLGIISDSHLWNFEDLPNKAINLLNGVDLIIHAGDYTGKGVVNRLKEFGNFKGVYGNIDPPNVREILPKNVTLELKNFKIGVTHPSEGGSPFGIEKRIKSKFDGVNVIIFGHTHFPKNEVIDGILFFNPGSITGKFPALKKTFGILEINKEIKGKIMKL